MSITLRFFLLNSNIFISIVLHLIKTSLRQLIALYQWTYSETVWYSRIAIVHKVPGVGFSKSHKCEIDRKS